MTTAPDRKPFAGRGCFKPLGSFTEGSLQNRIRQFFLANPDEELTYTDLCVKFDCTHAQARNAVREMVKSDGDSCTVQTMHLVRGRKVGA